MIRWLQPSVVFSLIVVAQSAPVARAWQDRREPAPRVPGFEIPAAPKDPDFPILSGAITPLDTVPGTPPLTTPDVPPGDVWRNPVMPPIPESWDRAVENSPLTRMGISQPAAVDDASAVTVFLVLTSILGVAAAVAAVASLRRREFDGPAQVVRMLPQSRKSS